MPKLHLIQPIFTYSACGTFTKHRERIQKFRETGHLKHIYKDELDKTCFSHNATYSDGKDLAKRIISDKILNDRTNKITRNPKYDEYQRGLAITVYKFFDGKTGLGASVNKDLAEDPHKQVIKKFKRRKVFVWFRNNIWVAGVAETRSLSSF